MLGGEFSASPLEQKEIVRTAATLLMQPVISPPLPSHFQREHLQSVRLVTTSQIFPLNCYQENVCLMNFCFITLLKQTHSQKTAVSYFSLTLCLEAHLCLFFSSKEKS